MTHSETPWYFEGDETPYITNPEIGMPGICDLYHMTPDRKIHLKENYVENGHRIVACVNACEGIPNEFLSHGSVEQLKLLASLVTVKQVIEAGDIYIQAAGLNPYCMNEGLANGNERIRMY